MQSVNNHRTVSDDIYSSEFSSTTDDSLKDEDNVAWVMQLPERVAKKWIAYLQFVRIPDRLLERDTFRKPKNNYSYTFSDFAQEWRQIRQNGKVNSKSPFVFLFEQLKKRWAREKLTEEDLKTWDLYLESLARYVKPGVIIHDEQEYEKALYGLSGTFFQGLPYAPSMYRREIGHLGILDQFYNNLRDLYEDTVRGISYYPTTLLGDYGIRRNELESLVSQPDDRFIRLNEYLLADFAARLKSETARLLSANGLHTSWRIGLRNTAIRHTRTEYVFRRVGFNAQRLNEVYWDYVRADLGQDVAKKFQYFKSTLRTPALVSDL